MAVSDRLEHVMQARLHVALDLGEAGGDQGYTFSDGPAAARSRVPGSNRRDGPAKEIEMQGLGDDSAAEEDSSLQHNAAQVLYCSWPAQVACPDKLLQNGPFPER